MSDKVKKKKKKEQEGEQIESTDASSSGAFSAPAFGTPILKRDIFKQHNAKKYNKEEEIDEATDSSSSGAFDVPFGGGTKGRKDPLRIDGPKSVKNSRAVRDKKFPKFGGPKGVYVKIKEKCKKFPYCNQGDINAIELLEMEELTTAINEVSKEYGIPREEMEKIVLNEINRIFI